MFKFITIYIFFSVWALAYSKQFKAVVEPMKTLDKLTFKEVDSLDKLDLLTLDPSIVYECKDTNSIVMHQGKLNTAARVAGAFALQQEDPDRWVEFEKTSLKSILGPRQPLTSCLDSTHGDGGTLAGTFGKAFGKTAMLDLPYGFDTGARLTPTLDYSVSVGTSFSVISGYQCTIPANSTGQVFIQPYYSEIKNAKYRYLSIKENPRRFKRSSKSVEYDEWNTVELLKFPSLFRKPLITCVTDKDYLICDDSEDKKFDVLQINKELGEE